jgi:hypothetical protein
MAMDINLLTGVGIFRETIKVLNILVGCFIFYV